MMPGNQRVASQLASGVAVTADGSRIFLPSTAQHATASIHPRPTAGRDIHGENNPNFGHPGVKRTEQTQDMEGGKRIR